MRQIAPLPEQQPVIGKDLSYDALVVLLASGSVKPNRRSLRSLQRWNTSGAMGPLGKGSWLTVLWIGVITFLSVMSLISHISDDQLLLYMGAACVPYGIACWREWRHQGWLLQRWAERLPSKPLTSQDAYVMRKTMDEYEELVRN